MSGLFSPTESFPSLSQLAFGAGNTVDPHLPICPSVASFHQRTEIGKREVGEGNEQKSERAGKQWIILCLAATGEKAWQICPKPKPVGVVWKRKDSLREIPLFG